MHRYRSRRSPAPTTQGLGVPLHAHPSCGSWGCSGGAPCWRRRCWESPQPGSCSHARGVSLHCHPECCTPRCHPTRQSAAARPLQGGQIFVLCSCLLQAISFFVSKVVSKLNLTEEMRIYFRKRYLGSLIYFNRKLKWLGWATSPYVFCQCFPNCQITTSIYIHLYFKKYIIFRQNRK